MGEINILQLKTPIGYTHTNSPIEGYNKTIKTNFTNHIKHNIKSSLEFFQDLVKYGFN